ncbi:MAG: hypothetical protein EP347_01650 [Alphaproteobacteria bacterium]|nr:MAG: hypothetical protein EP347_01650 [Alphaproteobacteria bacterium]
MGSLALALMLAAPSSFAEDVPMNTNPTYDATLAAELGADTYGMRSYVFVLLKTGPRDAEVTDKDARAEMFRGHFANINKLREQGDLVLVGPLDGENGLRGIMIFAADDISAAQAWMQGDPTVTSGIFELEFHSYYGTAALMKIGEIHARIAKSNVE